MSIYTHTTVMRSICLPLMYHGDDWKEILAEEIESYSTQFQQITDIIKDNWRDLHENRVTNAYRALPIFLDNHWNNTDKDLLKETIFE